MNKHSIWWFLVVCHDKCLLVFQYQCVFQWLSLSFVHRHCTALRYTVAVHATSRPVRFFFLVWGLQYWSDRFLAFGSFNSYQKANDDKLCSFFSGHFFVVLGKPNFHLGVPICFFSSQNFSIKINVPGKLWLSFNLSW